MEPGGERVRSRAALASAGGRGGTGAGTGTGTGTGAGTGRGTHGIRRERCAPGPVHLSHHHRLHGGARPGRAPRGALAGTHRPRACRSRSRPAGAVPRRFRTRNGLEAAGIRRPRRGWAGEPPQTVVR
ncbi:hypothetical protein B8W74_07780 [Arthrobacter agilis]|nr:hypothetical protein B8W74_07780 [Arthrobacter agilis]